MNLGGFIMNKSLYVSVALMTLITTPGYAAESGEVSPSASVAAINEIEVTLAGITVTEKASIDGADGSFTGTDAFELEFQNNNLAGYAITLTPTNGYLQLSGGSDNTGSRLKYKIACDSYDTVGADYTTVTAYNETQVNGTGAIILYDVATPKSATAVQTSPSGSEKQAPDCDITLGDNENVDDLFSGSYGETWTIAITNK